MVKSYNSIMMESKRLFAHYDGMVSYTGTWSSIKARLCTFGQLMFYPSAKWTMQQMQHTLD